MIGSGINPTTPPIESGSWGGFNILAYLIVFSHFKIFIKPYRPSLLYASDT
jgi:hypothetical protein